MKPPKHDPVREAPSCDDCTRLVQWCCCPATLLELSDEEAAERLRSVRAAERRAGVLRPEPN